MHEWESPCDQVLHVANSQVTDIGLEAIATQCPHLRNVSVARCAHIGDRALAALVRAYAWACFLPRPCFVVCENVV